MSDSDKARMFRVDVAEQFVISDPEFSRQLKAAPTATEFHAMLRNKFNHCDEKKDVELRLRLLRHMSRNKEFVFNEQNERG